MLAILKRLLLLLSCIMLSACHSAAVRSNNACDILMDQPSWYRYHQFYAKKYAVPSTTVLAFIAFESDFKPTARPVKSWLIRDVIPWQYHSSSYGYSQATNAAWTDFQNANPYSYYTRDDYPSSIAFISWYLYNYAADKEDVFDKYVIYHDGPNKSASKVPHATKVHAKKVSGLSNKYKQQLNSCAAALAWYDTWQPMI